MSTGNISSRYPRMAREATGVINSTFIAQSQVTLSLLSNLAITSKKNGFFFSLYYNTSTSSFKNGLQKTRLNYS